MTRFDQPNSQKIDIDQNNGNNNHIRVYQMHLKACQVSLMYDEGLPGCLSHRFVKTSSSGRFSVIKRFVLKFNFLSLRQLYICQTYRHGSVKISHSRQTSETKLSLKHPSVLSNKQRWCRSYRNSNIRHADSLRIENCKLRV